MEALVMLGGSTLIGLGLGLVAERQEFAAMRRRRMLPCVMEQQHDRPAEELQLLVVHIRGASFLSTFDRGEMKIRVKHGQQRVSSSCETAAVLFDREPVFRSTPKFSLVADFDTTCMFLWQGDPSSSLRVQLVTASRKGRVIAKAALPMRDEVGLQEFDLQLAGLTGRFMSSKGVVGHVSIATEILRMSRGDVLRLLERHRAPRRQGGFVLAEAPVTLGEIEGPREESEPEEESEREQDLVMLGLPTSI
jgi:hypothetical protein